MPTPTVQVSVRLPVDVYNTIKEDAEKMGSNIHAWLTALIKGEAETLAKAAKAKGGK